jgi:hypothetical protein
LTDAELYTYLPLTNPSKYEPFLLSLEMIEGQQLKMNAEQYNSSNLKIKIKWKTFDKAAAAIYSTSAY